MPMARWQVNTAHVPDTAIIFDNVEVIRVSDLGNWCRIRDRQVFIGSSVPLSGTTVRKPGDVGRLVIPRWFVQTQDLPESRN